MLTYDYADHDEKGGRGLGWQHTDEVIGEMCEDHDRRDGPIMALAHRWRRSSGGVKVQRQQWDVAAAIHEMMEEYTMLVDMGDTWQGIIFVLNSARMGHSWTIFNIYLPSSSDDRGRWDWAAMTRMQGVR